ncbi:HAD-IIA family hydrolase [Desulfobacter latus]|uniref:HAD family hydrolase n=1 Tax=Desulfobacter latus TaxID=2292 RepID=A0A850T328_9BACT|nr:HAD-IIA family hydrolase [Desulfobacter latus]NWH03602.1 HAD family hydrolase [Desulfobacter latus]
MRTDKRTYQKSFILDMDGVIYTGSKLIPGALDFVRRLKQKNFKFLFLTNNSYYTPRQLKTRLSKMGINVTADCFYTSAMATASFLQIQKPVDCSAYVIGGQGIIEELEKNKIRITSENPDYVVLAETEEYDYKKIIEATHLIREGAKFIATNSDLTGPTLRGPVPACGALVAPIEKVTGIAPYFLGKPNPAMMFWARKKMGVHSANCFMIGDRMDTDIIGGLESGMTTCLVLTGVTTRKNMTRFPYQPDYIFNHLGEIDPDTILSRRERVEKDL